MTSGDTMDPAKSAFHEALSQRDKVDTSEPDTTLWTGGYSAKAMFGTWLLSLIVTIGIIVAIILVPKDNLPQHSEWIAAAVVGAWWLLAIAYFVYERLSVRYELRTQRFIHRRGILTRVTDRIDVIDIDDVTFKQGLIERVLGVGTITLTGSDRTHPVLNLVGIDQVEKIAQLIDNVRRKERRRRSVHIDTN